MANCNEKNVITNAKWTWMQKNKKNSFKTWKFVTFFQNWQHFFEIPFFFANEKKKLIFETKKTKIMQQFQLKFFKNTLVRSIFYISNETLHFFNISFTETPWNYTKNQSFTETGRKKMGLFGIKLAKRTISSFQPPERVKPQIFTQVSLEPSYKKKDRFPFKTSF